MHLIGHNPSPLLQNTLAAVYGGNVAYPPFEVKNPEELGAAICGAYAPGIAGFSVIVPYKGTVISHLCGPNEEARLTGTTNTLVRTGEGYVGHDTDIADMATMLTRRNLQMEDAHIPLLGASGVARGMVVLVATGGAVELMILNRNTMRVEALTKAIRDINPFPIVWTAAPEHWRELPGNDYLCIQYTSAGMRPSTEEVIVENPRSFKKLSATADIVYTPEGTKFLRLTRTTGKSVASGLTMLVSQSAHTFSFWTDK